eukprot:79628-Hanusia_phi.AAC.3
MSSRRAAGGIQPSSSPGPAGRTRRVAGDIATSKSRPGLLPAAPPGSSGSYATCLLLLTPRHSLLCR